MPVAKHIQERIERIENGLLPDHAPDGPGGERVSLAGQMAATNVPGVSIAVINGHSVEWARGYGVKEAGKPDPVTAETIFQAASISKPLTAAAALRLVDGGDLDLDEDVNAYLKSWKVPPSGGWQPRITLRHLLSHTSGLTVHGFLGYAEQAERPTLRQVLDGEPPANSDPVRVDAIPGMSWHYSGGGYCVVQQLLEDVTGMPFPQLMHELVLDPLGITASAFSQPLPDNRANSAARGHYYTGAPVDGRWYIHPELAAAGLWSTPSDLARFVVGIQLALAGQAENPISASMAQQMITPQVRTPTGEAFGLGVALKPAGQFTWFGHGGSNVGYRCELLAHCRDGWGAVVMTNSDQGTVLAQKIIRATAEEYGWPDCFPEVPNPAQVGPPICRAYTGEYEPDGQRPGLSIICEEDALYLQCGVQHPILLHPVSETDYIAQALHVGVSFFKDATGAVAGLVLMQDGRRFVARKRGG